MMDFATVRLYVETLERQPAMAILPLQMVADFRGVSRANIAQMLRTGQLRPVKIDGTLFVEAKSLFDLEEHERSNVDKVRNYLESCARRGQRSVFYEPVMATIGLKTTIPAHRTIIGGILGKISSQTYREAGVLISVIVHRKTSGLTRPGPGFLPLAEALGCKWKDEIAFIDVETEKVINLYGNLGDHRSTLVYNHG